MKFFASDVRGAILDQDQDLFRGLVLALGAGKDEV